ncbi:hypothetical protein NDU88_007116 [Pleurodeles waltl]|uniref:Uncharacterized protein n=1 Tax=Pleurodeles waltl TaxID=8319 RepID=A0AAV7UNG5_PLEWA|nr:hypothetical protein NDU88_007116 [Pleurodeles waltl]
MRTLSETRLSKSAGSSGGQMGAFKVIARAAKRTRAHKRGLQQAPLALESDGERCKPLLEEGTLGGSANMAAPSMESAFSGLVTEEEELDYEEEVPVSGVQSVAAQKATTSGQAVQGDRLSCHRDLAGNLRRGEVSRESGLGGASCGDTMMVVQNAKNVDVAIQVEAGDGAKESKLEGSTSTTQAVAGKSVVNQVVFGDPMEAVPCGYLGTLSCGGRRSKRRHPGISESNWV